MSLKTIKVNPIFLMGAGKGGGSGGSGSSAKNKTRREKPIGVSLGQPNNIKKKLIARIKNFQQGGGIKINNNDTNTPTNATETFVDEFSQSVDFLNNLARDKQEDKAMAKRNKTLKKPRTSNPDAYMHVATELPPELLGGLTPIITPSVAANNVALSGANTVALSGANTVALSGANNVDPSAAATPPLWSAPPPPSYSNLKMGGTKPTYRTWLRNTQKNKPAVPSAKPSISILEDLMPVMSETAGLVPVLSETAGLAPTPAPAVLEPTPAPIPATTPAALAPTAFAPTAFAPIYTPSLKPKRKKITRTLKYKLGKHANGKVSVLIKNNQTRRKVQTEHAQLKLKSIIDIKNHLRSNNLLKVGSEAPNDVLRHLYEQSILAGQIENKAKDTLIHNYFNTEK